MVYSFILMSKIKRQLKVLHLPQQRENILSFLPILEEGDALIIGVDFPIPLIVKINAPTIKLDSSLLSSQNDKIKILILAKCLRYLLFGKIA